MNKNQTERPERNIKIGAVRAAIWRNSHIGRDGKRFEIRKVALERVYKDSHGNFRNANSFDINDIPKAILALQKAYEHLVRRPEEEEIELAIEQMKEQTTYC